MRHASRAGERRELLKFGASVGAGLTIAYALAFSLYSIARASATILTILSPAEAWPSLMTIDLTLLYLALVFALVIVTGPAVVGALTAWFLGNLSSRWNEEGSQDKAFGMGFLTGLAAVVTFHLILRVVLGDRLSTLHWEMYLFWFGLPSNLYLAACAGMALKIRKWQSPECSGQDRAAGSTKREETMV